jgi:serine/threonine-protein kinase
MIDPEEPVRDPADFIGHAGLVRRIYSRIAADRPQSVAVIGGKRSGKTSLLACISDDGGRIRSLPEGERFLFLRMGANRDTYRDPDSFLGALIELLSESRGDAANRYDVLRRRIHALHGAGRRVIVFLDDFQFITTNTSFPLEFFSFLRSMANNYNLAYVTTSILELQKLCAVKDVQESPFFNIFTNLHLGMLSPEDARALFTRVTGLGAGLTERAARWCGGSPYLLKKAGARLLPEKDAECMDEPGLERILFPVVQPYFEEIMALLAADAYKPLLAISKGRGPEPSSAHYLDPLLKQGFLTETEGKMSCFSPAFSLFLRKGLAPGMLTGKG